MVYCAIDQRKQLNSSEYGVCTLGSDSRFECRSRGLHVCMRRQESTWYHESCDFPQSPPLRYLSTLEYGYNFHRIADLLSIYQRGKFAVSACRPIASITLAPRPRRFCGF